MFDITFEEFENSVPRRSRKTLVISLLFSVVAHGIAFGYFYHEKIIGLPEIPISNQPVLHISLISSQNSNDSNQEPVVQRREDLKPATKEIIKPTAQKVPVNDRSDSMESIGQGLLLTNKSKVEEKSLKHSLNFERIRQAIRQREYENNFTTEVSQERYFNPVIDQHIKLQKKEIDRLRILREAEQRRKDNQYYEFVATDDTQIVRINGKCIDVPVNSGMEIETRLWLSRGDCRIKQALDFSESRLDREYREGRRDY